MDPSVRKTKRADELKSGDWLAAEQFAEDGDRPTEVLDTYPFSDDAGAAVLLVYRTLDGRPDSTPADAHQRFELAFEAEVQESRDDIRRGQTALQLHQLADLIVSKRLPLPGPYHHAAVTFNFGRDIEQVDRVGELLGIERTVDFGTASVRLPKLGEGLLTVGWDAYAPKEKPKPEPVADERCETCGESLREIELGALGHIPGEACAPAEPVAEHEISKGWKGDGLGECGVECKCGVTYDGFDSLAEAEKYLLRHIADPTGQDYGRADTAEADDPTPVSPARVPLHTGAVTDRGLIPCGCGPTHAPDCPLGHGA